MLQVREKAISLNEIANGQLVLNEIANGQLVFLCTFEGTSIACPIKHRRTRQVTLHTDCFSCTADANAGKNICNRRSSFVLPMTSS